MNKKPKKARSYYNRPRWACHLTPDLWYHLCEAQGTSRPTLRGLVADLHHQHAAGATCYECRAAYRRVGRDYTASTNPEDRAGVSLPDLLTTRTYLTTDPGLLAHEEAHQYWEQETTGNE